MSQREENPTMIIEVNQLDLPPKKAFVLNKPKDEGKWMNHYEVGLHKGSFVVQVRWNPDGPPCPSYLEFYCTFDSITGVGFSECKRKIEQYTKRGPCGGCFFLVSDIPGDSQSVVVENWGHQRKKGKPYHFNVWLKSSKVKLKFDPQIYNDGVIHPGGEPSKPRQGKGGKKGD
ncbi:MAG: hypothetical protein WAM82_00750 [Thermoanaerobaculia bacterium]